MTKYMMKLELLFMHRNVSSCTGRLHPRPNLRDLPCSGSIMSVSLLPVDLDAFISDQHKGKQVTAAASRWAIQVLSALLGVCLFTGKLT